MARRPIRGSATKQDTGKSCPFCRFPIKERDEVVACGECQSTHHEDCWEENGGCAVPDCAGGPRAERAPSDTGGTHIPPVAGPSRKKVTIDPRPAMRRRKRDRQRKKDPARAAATAAAAPPGKSSKTTLWIVGATVAFLVVIGAVMIGNNFGDSRSTERLSCEDGTGVDGVPCYENGMLPNRPIAVLNSEVTGFMRKWFRDINLGEYHYAWSRISPRVRKQISREIGYEEWMNRQAGISRYLEPGNLKVDFVQPSFSDDGVMSIRLSPMPYSKPGDRCGTRGGITWVKWDPKTSRWYHEPGAKVTSERQQAWGYRGSELFIYGCKT